MFSETLASTDESTQRQNPEKHHVILWFSSVPPSQAGIVSEVRSRPLHFLSDSLFTNDPIIRPYLVASLNEP
jgi:hypothetical protein